MSYPTIILGYSDEQKARIRHSQLQLAKTLQETMKGDWIYKGIEAALNPHYYTWNRWKYEVMHCWVWFDVSRKHAEKSFNEGYPIRITTLAMGRFIAKRKYNLPSLPHWADAPPMPELESDLTRNFKGLCGQFQKMLKDL